MHIQQNNKCTLVEKMCSCNRVNDSTRLHYLTLSSHHLLQCSFLYPYITLIGIYFHSIPLFDKNLLGVHSGVCGPLITLILSLQANLM